MAQATVAGEIHQALDVHRGLAAEVTLDRHVLVDLLADLQHLGVGQVLDATLARETEFGDDPERLGAPDAVNVSQRDLDALVGRDVDTRDTCHRLVSQAPRSTRAKRSISKRDTGKPEGIPVSSSVHSEAG